MCAVCAGAPGTLLFRLQCGHVVPAPQLDEIVSRWDGGPPRGGPLIPVCPFATCLKPVRGPLRYVRQLTACASAVVHASEELLRATETAAVTTLLAQGRASEAAERLRVLREDRWADERTSRLWHLLSGRTFSALGNATFAVRHFEQAAGGPTANDDLARAAACELNQLATALDISFRVLSSGSRPGRRLAISGASPDDDVDALKRRIIETASAAGGDGGLECCDPLRLRVSLFRDPPSGAWDGPGVWPVATLEPLQPIDDLCDVLPPPPARVLLGVTLENAGGDE